VKERLEQALSELTDAEDFLDYFEVSYDPRVVEVSRLHILRRFRDYLQRAAPSGEPSAGALRERYKCLLEQAYQDFVHSTPGKEKVFEVFHRRSREVVFIPIETLSKWRKPKKLFQQR
jgi:nitrogenase-stabilizing/protective protein